MKTIDSNEEDKFFTDRDPLTSKVIGCAIEVHKNLGPGLLESTYEKCLTYELNTSGLECKTQLILPVKYKNTTVDCGYRIDLLVENSLIIEIKSVDCILSVHEAQTLTYMKLLKAPIGLLINFNVKLLASGVRRLFLK